jgi:hypothetical protein
MTSNLNRAAPLQALRLHFQRTPCQPNVSCCHASLLHSVYDQTDANPLLHNATGPERPGRKGCSRFSSTRGQPLIRWSERSCPSNTTTGSTGSYLALARSPKSPPDATTRRRCRARGGHQCLKTRPVTAT